MRFPFFSQNRVKSPNKKHTRITPWLDIFALLTWGILLLKYIITDQLKLLIHPNYNGLVLVTSIILLLLATIQGLQMLRSNIKQKDGTKPNEHIILFPPGFSSSILLVVALLGLFIAPNVLSSQAALQRGVTDTLPLTRFQPQSFRISTKPEERSLLDWVRTLNAYPEPDAYTGQKANVKGFVIHLPELPDNYLLLARFVVTCCAVDAYPVGIPVQLANRYSTYPQDTWLAVKGEMTTASLAMINHNGEIEPEERQLVLIAQSIEEIPTPNNPYDY